MSRHNLFRLKNAAEAQSLAVTSLYELRNARFANQNGRTGNAMYVHSRIWTSRNNLFSHTNIGKNPIYIIHPKKLFVKYCGLVNFDVDMTNHRKSFFDFRLYVVYFFTDKARDSVCKIRIEFLKLLKVTINLIILVAHRLPAIRLF